MVEASRRSNAAIYFLNSRGPGGDARGHDRAVRPRPAEPGHRRRRSARPSRRRKARTPWPSDSGGFTRAQHQRPRRRASSGSPTRPAPTTWSATTPRTPRRDGKFRKIQVKVPGGKGLQVRARKGYYAPCDDGKTASPPSRAQDPAIQAALDSPVRGGPDPAAHDRTTSASETVLGKATVVIATEVDVRAFAFQEKDGRLLDTVEFLLVAAHRESGEYFRYDQAVEMKLLPATRERSREPGCPSSRDFELKARRLPGQDRGAGQELAAHRHGRPRVRGARPSRRSGSPPRSSATRAR